MITAERNVLKNLINDTLRTTLKDSATNASLGSEEYLVISERTYYSVSEYCETIIIPQSTKIKCMEDDMLKYTEDPWIDTYERRIQIVTEMFVTHKYNKKILRQNRSISTWIMKMRRLMDSLVHWLYSRKISECNNHIFSLQ